MKLIIIYQIYFLYFKKSLHIFIHSKLFNLIINFSILDNIFIYIYTFIIPKYVYIYYMKDFYEKA